MKTYSLNEYYRFEGLSGTRIEIYSNNSVAANLITHHRIKGGTEITLSECINDTLALLPMPDAVLSELSKRIEDVNQNGSQAIVTGIDAYLALLNEENTRAFKYALRRRADSDRSNVIYMIGNLYIPDVADIFNAPKYTDNLYVAIIDEGINETAPPDVTIVSEKWVNCDSYVSEWTVLLKNMGNFSPSGSHTLVITDFNEYQAGLSSTVYQLTDLQKIAEKFYNLTETLPNEVTEKLLCQCKVQNKKIPQLLEENFGIENSNTSLGVKRLYELRSDELWIAYVWHLKQSIELNSYLAKVISKTVTADCFISEYVCDTAVTLIEDTNAEKYANERAIAIRELPDIIEPKIIDFIRKSEDKSDDTVIIWLNNGTVSENTEILRRIQNIDLSVGLPKKYAAVYPVLADYLSDKYPFEEDSLTDYFKEYRQQKIRNTVSKNFVKLAYDNFDTLNFVSRDNLLTELNDDKNCALLIADGMGAEYYPLLLSMSKRMGINVQSATIAKTRMPSSTEFNNIIWPSDRRLDDKKGIDNVSHDGAEKHENSLPEKDLCATLSKFNEIFISISNALSKYECVVVTADHGSSRLACIAHKNKLSETLPWNEKSESIQSCRYTIASVNNRLTSDYMTFYDASKGLTYWIVKGYNRLPKKGGYSVHGGATLEECLVPVIVFSKNKVDTEVMLLDKKSNEQLVEKKGSISKEWWIKMYDVDRLRKNFPSTTVYKDPRVMAIFKSAKIEAFLRDWIIKRKADSNGRIEDADALSEYVASIIPRKSDRERLEDEARTNGETRAFLAKINVQFHTNANYYSFEITDLGFSHAHTIIEDYVWERIKDEIIGEAGGWGLIKLGYMPPEGGKKNGKFTLLDYKNFCPYEVSLEAFREARSHYENTEEWMDVLLGAIDYNADGFNRKSLDKEMNEVWNAKHTMLTRLLPFIQPRINLIELAPQQTGKSYIFGKIGKYGWLAGGGSISRAKMFLDMRPGAKSSGLVTFSDFVAIDEVKSIKFTNDKEMAGILKGYMEDGRVKVGDTNVEGEAGIIFLGNIDVNDMDGSKDMFRELPDIFKDTALIQRIHGFVPGKNIPPLSPKMYISGWALNTEYFTEIMHLFRSPAENMRYRGFVEELVTSGANSDETSGREKEAVMRVCTAYLKLFFPHVNSDLIKDNKFRKEFKEYCLNPAVRMQDTVLKQMQILNPSEFAHRSMSTYKLREDNL